MLRHYLVILFRSSKRYKTSFFINVIGLSTSLACVIFIMFWVTDELNVDRFHEKDERLYQVMESNIVADENRIIDRSSGLVAETLKEEVPEIEYASAVMHYSRIPEFILSPDGIQKTKAIGQFVGKDFFNIFSYELLNGDKNGVLVDKKAIVISEELAKKTFGSGQEAMGKILNWELGPFERESIISGVFKETPFNSTQQFDFVLSYEDFKDISPAVLEWGNTGTNAYVALKEGADIDLVNSKIKGTIKARIDATERKIFLKPFSENYLYGTYENGVQKGGRIEYVKLFSLIALFILIMACINFMNLSTAKALRRANEVGVKKAIGADRKSLIFQYLGESVIITIISLLLAILLVYLFLPQFNIITGKQLSLVFDLKFLMILLSIVILTGLVSGSYPALFLSSFDPETVLKGKMSKSIGELWVSRILVIFQFTISIILIVSVIVVYRQIELVQNKNPGYNRENVVYFEKEGLALDNLDSFLAELKRIPGVMATSSISNILIGTHNKTGGIDWEGKNPNTTIGFEIMDVNYGLIELMDLKLSKGRPFSRDYGADSTKIIFNETAIKQMKLTDPIGKNVTVGNENRQIIGVLKDFHFESLYDEVKPVFMKLNKSNTYTIMLRIEKGKTRQVLSDLQEFYRKYNPGYTLDYKFLEAQYEAQYVAERRVSLLSRYFAALSIIISCLGLFGLAAFTAQRRRKEIGIRKALGSSDFGIVSLLSTDFTKMVILSILVALPVSYFLLKSWLEGFAYRIDLQLWIFVLSGFAALSIAWISVVTQAYKASRLDPVECLKEDG